MKDEKEHHGAVDEPSSEQQFHKSTFVVCKVWSHTPSASESYGRPAGRQLDKTLAGRFEFLADCIAMEI